MNLEDSTVTLTFCECAENHKGMQKLGRIAETGFTIPDLERVIEKLGEEKCELIRLNIKEVQAEEAAILVIRDGVNVLLEKDKKDGKSFSNLLADEMFALEWDKKALMYGRVVNKKARHNLVFGPEAQDPDYAEGKGTVVPFSSLPILSRLREALSEIMGEKAQALFCEGNCYYDWRTC